MDPPHPPPVDSLDALSQYAAALRQAEDLATALAACRQLELKSRQQANLRWLRWAIREQALIADQRGDRQEALTLFGRTATLCRHTRKRRGLRFALARQAVLLRRLGDFEGAFGIHAQEEALCLELGDHDGRARSLTNQALVLRRLGRTAQALQMLRQAESLWSEAADHDGLSSCFSLQAELFEGCGDVRGALALNQQALDLCASPPAPAAVRVILLADRGQLCEKAGDRATALACYREAETLAGGLDVTADLGTIIGHQARLLEAQKELAAALRARQKQAQIWRALGFQKELARNLTSQALLHDSLGDTAGALDVHHQEEALYRELGNQEGLRVSFNNQALVVAKQGDELRALHLLHQAEQIARQAGNQAGLKKALANRAFVLGQLVRRRGIRVFVSSTFHDLVEERNELAKRVFPLLRQCCEEKGLSWAEVDLRWGVPQEERAEILERCLAQIDRCRPFFIGILADRYGSRPPEIPPALLAKEPWLAQVVDRSVTEIEMLHGVLNHPELAAGAFFYLRDAAGTADAGESCDRSRLDALKQRIRQSGAAVRTFQTSLDLGAAIAADFGGVIAAATRSAPKVDPLLRAAAAQEDFARLRAEAHAGGEVNYARLDGHAKGDGPPLVVIGAAGCGKTALLAAWVVRRRSRAVEDRLLFHFISRGSGLREVLERLTAEIRRLFDLPADSAAGRDVHSAFEQCLRLAAGKGRLVLVVDGLDQLEAGGGGLELAWLPLEIPANVRMILSTFRGPTFDALLARGWPMLDVSLLTPGERREVVATGLAHHGKALAPALVERIAGAKSSALALFLSTVIEELRLHGDFDSLGEAVDHLLAAAEPTDLFDLVLERYERDCERDHPGLVRSAFSLLWATRKGLSEADLLDLLGADGERLAAGAWSDLYLQSRRWLLLHSGLLALGQGALRRAVKRRYLESGDEQRKAHLRLAHYFKGRKQDARRVDELPWQWAAAQVWQELRDLLCDPTFFQQLWLRDASALKAYWAQVQASSSFRLLDAYRSVWTAPQSTDRGFSANVASLLAATGHRPEALAIRQWLVQSLPPDCSPSMLAKALNNLGLSCVATGDLDQAANTFAKAETLCRELADRKLLCLVLANRALVLIKQDARDPGFRPRLLNRPRESARLDSAREILRQQEALCRELQYHQALAFSLLYQFRALATFKGSRPVDLLKESERLFLQAGDRAGWAQNLYAQSAFQASRGYWQEAMRLAKWHEQICRELGVAQGIEGSHNLQDLHRQGAFAGGIVDEIQDLLEFEDQERRFRQSGQEVEAMEAVSGQARILVKHAESRQRGLDLYQQVVTFFRARGDDEGLLSALVALCNALWRTTMPWRTAKPIFDEALRLAKSRRSSDVRMEIRAARFVALCAATARPLLRRFIALSDRFPTSPSR
jgi:prepilin-type processing-associated H-X9-DG protein